MEPSSDGVAMSFPMEWVRRKDEYEDAAGATT